MKQLALIAVGLLLSIKAFSQQDRVDRAWSSFRNNKLEKALANIGVATQHDDTKNSPEAWLCQGHVCYAIDTTSSSKFSGLVEHPKNKAVDAYAKAKRLDEDGEYITQVRNNAVKLGVKLFNTGAEDYNSGLKAKKQKDTTASKEYFEKSLSHFERYFKARDIAGKYASYITQSLTQNGIDPKKILLYSGYSAYQIEDYDEAIKYLNQSLEADAKEVDGYLFLSSVYMAKGDTAKSKQIINKGLTEIPGDQALKDKMVEIRKQSARRKSTQNAQDSSSNQKQQQDTKDNSPNFREAKWGMTKSEVKKKESKSIIDEDKNSLLYKDQLMNLEVKILYRFTKNNKLAQASYVFDESHSANNEHISDFENIKRLLKKKYGEPMREGVNWINDLYKEDKNNWGTALALGHVVFYCVFETAETKIAASLQGDNMEINHGISYQSLKYAPEVNKEREKETLDDL